MDILHRVGIRSPAHAVYDALATRDGLAGWWTHDTEGDGAAGGRLSFNFSADGQPIGGFEMQVLDARPAERVTWQVTGGPAEWIGTCVDWQLRQDGDYTIVMFRHQGWKEPVEFMHHCSTKWATYLMSLKSLVETGRGAPSPDDVRVGDWH